MASAEEGMVGLKSGAISKEQALYSVLGGGQGMGDLWGGAKG